MNSCPLASGARVWAYCRDSGGEEQDIESQKHAVLDYIEANGLVLDRLFVDEARPGSSVVGRQAFELMIDLSRQAPPLVEAIVLCAGWLDALPALRVGDDRGARRPGSTSIERSWGSRKRKRR